MTEMIACEDCGQMVPEQNVLVHRAHGCRGVARSATATSSTREDDNDDEDEEHLEAEAGTSTTAATSSCEEDDEDDDDNDDEVIDLSADSPASKGSRKRQDEAPSSPPPRRRQRRGRPKRDQDEESDDAMDIDESSDDDEVEIVGNNNNNNSNEVEIVDNPEVATSSSVAAAASATAEVVDLLEDDDDEWACKRCTLLNDKSKPRCEACGERNPSFAATSRGSSDGVRAPDQTRRERLIDDDDFFAGGAAAGGSPLSLMGGGALLGGFLGAAGNYMRGRSVTSGAFEGGVAGAAGGFLVNELARNSNNHSNSAANRHRQRQRQRHSAPATDGGRSSRRQYDTGSNQLSEARSAGANGQPAYPVMDRRSSGRAAPRSSIRVVNQQGPNGTTHTIVSSSGREGTTRIVRRSTHTGAGRGGHDDLLGLMLHTMIQDRAGGSGRMSARFGGMGGGDAIDRMSYDQLLAAFGDGSENRGASIQDISSLPTAKVKTKPDGSIDLPADARECSICLEEFEEGQIRKTLPCLHGFHSDCVDKWLQTNGACPVCKFRVDERGSSS